jgi:ATP-dependent DNA helicase RecG
MKPPAEQLPLDLEPVGLVTVEAIYVRADQALLQTLREDRRIERKPTSVQPAFLGEYISMWANTPGGGLVVIGLTDDGSVAGCNSLGQESLNRLEQTGRDYAPEARYATRRIAATRPDGSGDFLLLFHVRYREDKVVRTVRGDSYIRYGDSKRKLTPEEVRELEADKGQVDVEQERVRLTYPDDFDTSAVDAFADRVRKGMDLDDRLPADEILELRRLGRREGGRFVPNLACALLFARDPCLLVPGCKVRILRFDGDHEGAGVKFNVVKDLTVEGTIPYVIQSTADILTHQLRDFSRLGPDNKFYTAPEYPRPAWYEAVVNACVHRSYGLMKNMNVFVKMFDNRLVIESPGGFPPPVTADTVYEIHQPRNPHLMEAMRFLDYVKCAREGTRRMRESMTRADLPAPEFEQKDVSHALVRVTLRNNIALRKVWLDSDATEIVGETIAQTLSEDERRAINFAAEHGKVNASQVQRLTQKTWPQAQKLLVGLADKRVLRHVHRRGLDRDPQAHFVLAGSAGREHGR